MFEPLFAAAPPAPGWLSAAAPARFDPSAAPAASDAVEPAVDYEAEIARAFAAGRAEGERLAREQAAAATPPMGALDTAMEARLAEKLREAVAALCEPTLAPLTLDREALAARCAAAARLLTREESTLTLRCHPDTAALLSGALPDGWAIEPDAACEPGALDLSDGEAVIRDGPPEWRARLAEALGAC